MTKKNKFEKGDSSLSNKKLKKSDFQAEFLETSNVRA